VRPLLDEMLAPRIARELRSRAHDVVAIGEREGWTGLSDDAVLELARDQRRAVVTANLRDFRPRAAAAVLPGGPGHHGMVFVPTGYRRTKADTGRLVAALAALLEAHPGDDDLHGQEVWLP
jgi:hypothetical protein